MNAIAVGLELEINLSLLELVRLKSQPLEGILRFRDIYEKNEREIPLALRYISGASESVNVSFRPLNNYFGNAHHIDIEIQDPLYDCLDEKKFCGDRFFGSGKILVYVR